MAGIFVKKQLLPFLRVQQPALVGCSAASSGLDDPAYITFFKKPLDELLCTFVTFVFQKTALRGSVMCSAILSGVDDVRHLCLKSSV